MTRGHGTQHTSAAKPFNDRHPTPYRLVIFLSVALLAAVAAGQDQAQHQVSGNGPAQLPLRGPTPVDVLTSRAVSPAATPPLAATARTTWKPSEDNGLSADTSVELPILEYTVLREIRESFIDLRPGKFRAVRALQNQSK